MRLTELEARLAAMQSGDASPDEIAGLLDDVRSGGVDDDEDAQKQNAQDEREDWYSFRGAPAGRSAPIPPPVIQVSSGTSYNPGPTVDIIGARFNRPRRVTATFQADGTLAFAVVQTNIGAAQFTRVFPMPVNMPRSIQVYGSSVNIGAYAGNSSLVQPTCKNATAAISPEGVDPLGDLFPQWVPQNGNALAFNIGPAGAGVLLGASGWLDTLGTGDTANWVLGFDSTTAPVSGTTAPLVSFGPLTAVNMPFSFDRSLRPSVYFATGLYWAISKTGGLFTTTGGGAGKFAIQYDWSD
jgi:hypothetical protein